MYIRKDVNLEEAKQTIQDGGIVFTTAADRDIGKSSAIKAYASWTGIPILADSKVREMGYHGQIPLKTINIKNLERYLLGRSPIEAEFLVDDISYEDYISLRNNFPHIEMSGFVHLI